MVSRLQRRVALRRKLQILKTLTCSKSVKKSCIIADTVLYIYNLKLRLDTLKKDLSNSDAIKSKHFPKKEVEVEKSGKGMVVRVKCEKGEDSNYLGGIVEVIEGMGLMVLNASVSNEYYFDMEAIVVPSEDIQNAVDLNIAAQAIHQAIENICNVNKGI
ncbi:uncharacterized protein [Euphorbia lathyris]|uniref:uncharacterized protein n=1 Tax=Euphorbia lathyris TaxID=212925 RepID=UPI0033143A27